MTDRITIKCRFKDGNARGECDNGVQHYFGDQPMPPYDGPCRRCNGTGKHEVSREEVEHQLDSVKGILESYRRELEYWTHLKSRFK